MTHIFVLSLQGQLVAQKLEEYVTCTKTNKQEIFQKRALLKLQWCLLTFYDTDKNDSYSSTKTKFWDQSIQGLSTNLESIGVYLGVLHSHNIRVRRQQYCLKALKGYQLELPISYNIYVNFWLGLIT